jgi:hypothetical protein
MSVLSGTQAAHQVLQPREPISLTTSVTYDPDVYYRTGKGLYVWNSFRNRIVANAKPTNAGTGYTLAAADLTKDATDKEIEAALPEGYLFDESAVCAIVAELIAKQPGGEAGHLQNNGRANLFYTRSCVVRVRWDAGDGEWRVLTWGRGGDGWYAGRRVFSRN